MSSSLPDALAGAIPDALAEALESADLKADELPSMVERLTAVARDCGLKSIKEVVEGVERLNKVHGEFLMEACNPEVNIDQYLINNDPVDLSEMEDLFLTRGQLGYGLSNAECWDVWLWLQQQC